MASEKAFEKENPPTDLVLYKGPYIRKDVAYNM